METQEWACRAYCLQSLGREPAVRKVPFGNKVPFYFYSKEWLCLVNSKCDPVGQDPEMGYDRTRS